MRLLPGSLFGRVLAVLIVGLALVLSIGAVLHLRERSDLLQQAGAAGMARQIADAVRVLDAQDPAARASTAASLGSASLNVTLGQTPSNPGDSVRGPRAARIEALLDAYLGDRREIRLGPGMGMPAMPMGGASMPHAMSSMQPPTIQVRLRDGTWASFASAAPQLHVAWPYHLLIEAIALMLLVIAVSVIAVRRATRPLAVLASAADELGANINRAPLPEEGPDEVRRAARAFNSMQARLKDYIEDRGRILAAIAHDLKTPLALLRLRTEALSYDAELKTKFEGDLKRMEQLVAETLDFVRTLDSPEAARPVDVVALLETLKADTAALGWRVEIAGRAKPYPGRAQALQRCVTNLVENAVRYGKSASIALEDTDDELRIRVRDQGPGIPERELERVFEPFYRLEASRNRATGGTGLGLAIARTIARAHGGTVTLRNPEGGGLEAVLILPR